MNIDKYTVDLLREISRLPLYYDFDVWKPIGQRFCINFDSANPPSGARGKVQPAGQDGDAGRNSGFPRTTFRTLGEVKVYGTFNTFKT